MLLTLRAQSWRNSGNTANSLSGPDGFHVVSFLQKSRLKYRPGVDSRERL